MSKYQELEQNIQNFSKGLDKHSERKKEKKIKKKEELHELFDSMEEQSNHIFSKLEDLNRKPIIMINIGKIIPEIPQSFPKNYNIQILYEDVTMTGNQKFVDFDENIIDEKIILPLLSSETAKFQLWVAQEEPSLFDKGIINLQSDISQALEKSTYEGEIKLQSNNLTVSYTLQIQGIGFNAWLKNLAIYRESSELRKKSRKETEMKKDNMKQKVETMKMRFNKNFKQGNKKTAEYEIDQIDQIMDSLKD